MASDGTAKERTQRLVLAGLVSLVIVTVYWFLALSPILARRAEVNQKISQLTKTNRDNEGLLATAADVEKEYTQLRDKLLHTIREELAPQENPIAWTGELARRGALQAGIPEGSRALREGAQTRRKAVKGAPVELLEDYVAETNLQCGYHQFGVFLASLEQDVPSVRLQSLTMAVDQRSEEPRLQVAMTALFARFTAEGLPAESHPSAPLPVVRKKTAPPADTQRPDK